MGKHTSIAWTDHTFNPWRGCTRVSSGCDNCYAESWSKRNPSVLGVWGDNGTRVVASDSYWREPLRWDRDAAKRGVRERVFCASLADVFEDRTDLVDPRARLWRLIALTPNLDWLLLTKRPENAAHMADRAAGPGGYDGSLLRVPVKPWPSNVWLGTTVENQAMADARIPRILCVPAAVRFLSCEPLLEAVDLGLMWRTDTGRWDSTGRELPLRRIDWVICGGESGAHARPFDVAWARSLVAQCRSAGVACFVKQLGARPAIAPDELAHRGWSAASAVVDDCGGIHTKDRAGADPSEWPTDLRVQEWPHSMAAEGR